MLFLLESLQVSQKSVPLHCVFHGIRFKVNKGWAQRSPFYARTSGTRCLC